MFHVSIKVGTKVKPICDDVLPNVTAESRGEIVMLRIADRQKRDFHATIHWDNGTETFLNALFFFKTVEIVDELGCA